MMRDYYKNVKRSEQALFAGLSDEELERWMTYLYAQPQSKTSQLTLKPHIVAIYDPFADRKSFLAGRRWCINVYTGCSHQCAYCYAQNYIENSFKGRVKKEYRSRLVKDVEQMLKLELHAAPVHLSNSTDAFQPLEHQINDTLYTLRLLANMRYHQLFSVISLLSKNSIIMTEPEYLNVLLSLHDMGRLNIEISCMLAFEHIRQVLEPGAPPVRERLQAMKVLCSHGLNVALRIDPLFPRDPLPNGKSLNDYNAIEVHTEHNLRSLVRYAAQIGCYRVITSGMKVPRNAVQLCNMWRPVYRDINNGTEILRSNSYRYNDDYYKYLVSCLEDEGKNCGIEVVFCKKSLYLTV